MFPFRGQRASGAREDGYLACSRRPLQILVFLLPLVIAYELGLTVLLRSETGLHTNEAHKTILQAFLTFGVADSRWFYHLGGLVIVVVLLIWHVLARDPWRVDLRRAGVMALESLALTAPLIVFGSIIGQQMAAAALAPASGSEATTWQQLGVLDRMAISVGAGLYEELLFRMVLIAVLHTLIVDLAGASERLGVTVAVVLSAAAFTVYHPLGVDGDPSRLSAQKLVFFMAAGLYFGGLYVWRGFGIVVAVHALYDILTVWMSALVQP